MAKILVIEDERATRANIVNFLESEGFSTIVAENGELGIQLAQEHLPDLIICDILMPELDGYDVLITLQKETQTASIPFIFLTMTATEAGLQQSLDLGADDYLSKPITSEQLRNAITAQLQKVQSQKQGQKHILPDFGDQAGLNFAGLNYMGLGHAEPDPVEPSHIEPIYSALDNSWPGNTEPPDFIKQLKSIASDLPNELASASDPILTQEQELQQFIQAKDRLFYQLSYGLRQHLSKVSRTVQSLKTGQLQKPTESERDLQALQEVTVRLLTLVNEVTALYNVLTPENAEILLEQFKLTDDSERQ